MIRIITADDHALIRKGIVHMLSKLEDIHSIDEAMDGRQLLKMVRRNHYDIILLDINMPGMDVLDVIPHIKELDPEVKILILSMLPEEQFGLQMLKAGAAGYLNKSSQLNELEHAVRHIVDGGKFISPALAKNLADFLEKERPGELHETLSAREFQLLCQIGAGKTVSEISESLCLSVKTVSTYRSRLLQKMGLKNNAQLTYYAIEHRLV